MTFSIVARCPETGMLGGAVCSSSPAVGARCLSAKRHVGAALTQNFTDPMLGQQCLELLARGASAQQAIDITRANAEQSDYRQLALIAPQGAPACFTGDLCMDTKAMAVGVHAVAIGNLLASADVPARMLETFEQSSGHLAGRLVAAMQAGLRAGGEIEAVHSAGVVVVQDLPWPIVDLRVDWTDSDPLAELESLWRRWESVMPIYVARALTPQTAPTTDAPV